MPNLLSLSALMPPPSPAKLSFHFHFHFHFHFRSLCTSTTSETSATSPIEPTSFLRLCTVLYQQQNSPLPKLQSHLQKLHFPPPSHHHELFLQVCNKFPYSWKPVHNLHLHLSRTHNFTHTPTTANKALDVFGRARNIDLLSSFLRDASRQGLADRNTLRIAASHFGDAREVKKCVGLTELHGQPIDALNSVVATLCDKRLVEVAKAVVWKAISATKIQPDETTYSLLVVGFCRAGDLTEACRIWNRMVDSGLEPAVDAYREIVVTLFKVNRFEDAMSFFKTMRRRRFADMSLAPYREVIDWMCKEGKITYAFMVFDDMLKRGVGVDNSTLGALVYALLARKRVREGYRVLQRVEFPDVSIYHGLMKGLVRIRRAGEATQVLREMVRRGCEPTMHTYIMLLQAHLGKRGRKARNPLVNFDTIFVGGLVKAGKTLQATKYAERIMWGAVKVPRFDYNKFLHYFSNEEGVVMFEEVGRKLKEAGMVDLGDIFLVYGERMATRDRRRRAGVDRLGTSKAAILSAE